MSDAEYSGWLAIAAKAGLSLSAAIRDVGTGALRLYKAPIFK